MVTPLRIISALCTLACYLSMSASPVTDTRNALVHPSFHTLQVSVDGNEMAPPIITLGSDDRITISFDELATDRRYMRYELIHCNSRWQPDHLVAPEYLDGFNEASVDDYAFSQATSVPYVNYRITLPNPNMSMKISGNYLLRVYDENNPDRTLLQARFSVIEPAVKVNASVTSRTDIDYNDSHQQLTIAVDTEGLPVSNIFNDLLISVQQNGRTDNEAYTSHPTRLAGNVAWFEHDRNLIFPAGNEYRRMEITSTTYPGMRVSQLSYADPYYHADLFTDYPRNETSYEYDRTQHGRFKVREYNSDESDTEADYIVTHFSLDIPEQNSYDIFLDGDFLQRRFDPQSRMVLNRATGMYENAILLKQGAYNYQYLAVPHGAVTGHTAPIEGDKYQTSNEYLIKVYYREPGSRYDRLVGASMATSGI